MKKHDIFAVDSEAVSISKLFRSKAFNEMPLLERILALHSSWRTGDGVLYDGHHIRMNAQKCNENYTFEYVGSCELPTYSVGSSENGYVLEKTSPRHGELFITCSMDTARVYINETHYYQWNYKENRIAVKGDSFGGEYQVDAFHHFEFPISLVSIGKCYCGGDRLHCDSSDVFYECNCTHRHEKVTIPDDLKEEVDNSWLIYD